MQRPPEPEFCSTTAKMTRYRFPFVCFQTDNEYVNTLCLRYWAVSSSGKWTEPFDTLLSESGLNKPELMSILRSACRAVLPHLRCERCKTPLAVANRSQYSPSTGSLLRFGKRLRAPLCGACSAATTAEEQRTDYFKINQPRQRIAEAVQQLHAQINPVDYTKLTYVQSYLLYAALVAAGVSRDNPVVPALDIQTGRLTPTPALSEYIYTRLYIDKLILPALTSDFEVFNLDERTGAITFNVGTVHWTVTNDVSGRSVEEIISVLFRSIERPEPLAAAELWYLVAEDECKRYLLSQCERYRFIQPGIYSSKVAAAIRDYLDRCSIGQMWNIIYYAIKNLAALAQEGKFTPQHIYNMIPGSLRRYADYRLANGDSIRPWRRPAPTTESWVTSILLDGVLKSGDIAFQALSGRDVMEHIKGLAGDTK